MKINASLTPAKLSKKTARVFELAGEKIRALDAAWDPSKGTPVFTVAGKYSSRGWTEWTQGFQFGMAFLHYDATGDTAMLERGRVKTVRHMASHVSHVGVHDHGFNNVSTYGNQRRLMLEGKTRFNQAELDYTEVALKTSGAVQAARYATTQYKQPWSPVPGAAGVAPSGYVYSFNGPQSLFADTIRSMRSLVVAHQLGHVLMGEGDKPTNLLHRAIEHAATTARFNVFFGQGRDSYDVRGRVAHESVFNRNDGQFRCPSSQQGYSPFTTWTRGAAWIITGYAEQLEFLDTVKGTDLDAVGGRRAVTDLFLETAKATSDYYIDGYSAKDGIPYWDSAALNTHRLGDFTKRAADPFNAPRTRRQFRRRHRRARYAPPSAAGSTPTAKKPPAKNISKPASPLPTRFSPSPISRPTKSTRAFCCTASITAPTAGTTSRRAKKCPAGSPRCGAITTPWNSRC
jgi:unsaturated chondroitin disaccharide hydrolase